MGDVGDRQVALCMHAAHTTQRRARHRAAVVTAVRGEDLEPARVALCEADRVLDRLPREAQRLLTAHLRPTVVVRGSAVHPDVICHPAWRGTFR